MNANPLKRSSNSLTDSPSKRQREIPWINWAEAEQACQKAQSIEQFVQKWKSNEIYLDAPTGECYHLNFEFPEKSTSKIYLTIDQCDGAEDVELVDLRIQEGEVKIRWIETEVDPSFSKAWEITQLTVKLFNINALRASDYYHIGDEIPEQLIASLKGATRFEAVGLSAPEEVKKAQAFLCSFCLGDLKGILEGFRSAVAIVTKLCHQNSLTDQNTLKDLIPLLSGNELQSLFRACLNPWRPVKGMKHHRLLHPYLKALATLSKPNVYSITWENRSDIQENDASFLDKPASEDFKTRFEDFTKATRNPFPYAQTTSLVIKVVQAKKFESTALSETLLRDDPLKKNRFHRFVTVAEKTEKQATTILKLTYSPEGHKAELGWIQRGKVLSGTQVFEIFNKINGYLQPGTTYIFDDANVAVGKQRQGGNELSLRQINALVSREGVLNSWYEKKGFTVLPVLAKSPFLKRALGTSYLYDPEQYRVSCQFIRNTTASYLLDSTLRNYPEEQKNLLALGTQYLNKQEFTIHELFAAIYEADRNSDDLYALYNICFRDFKEREFSKNAFPEAFIKYRDFVNHFTLFSLNPILFKNRT